MRNSEAAQPSNPGRMAGLRSASISPLRFYSTCWTFCIFLMNSNQYILWKGKCDLWNSSTKSLIIWRASLWRVRLPMLQLKGLRSTTCTLYKCSSCAFRWPFGRLASVFHWFHRSKSLKLYHPDLPLDLLLLVAQLSHDIIAGVKCLVCRPVHHFDSVGLFLGLIV